MVGLQRTFSAPDCASPTASPFLDDDRQLAGGPQDYLSAFPAASQPQPFDLFGFYNNLGLECVDPQTVFAAPVAVGYAAAPAVPYAPAPATHHGGPVSAPIPTPMDLLARSTAPQSYMSFNMFNAPVFESPDFYDQPACINPADIGGTPQGLNALLDCSLPRPAPYAAAPQTHILDPELAVSEDVVGGVNDAGLDSEPELVSDDCLVPSPSSTLNTDLPDDAAPKSKSKSKSKKRPSSGGDRKSKRRRGSARDDDEEYAEASVSEAEPEVESDNDGEYKPAAVSRSGRPVRGTRRVSSSKPAAPVDVSDAEGEEPVPERTCGFCSKTFARIAEKQRHEQAASCRTDAKAVCPVCHSEITGRSDAMRRHQLRTQKCIKIQDTWTPEQLAAVACVTAEEREIDRQRPAAKKQAAKKQTKKSRS